MGISRLLLFFNLQMGVGGGHRPRPPSRAVSRPPASGQIRVYEAACELDGAEDGEFGLQRFGDGLWSFDRRSLRLRLDVDGETRARGGGRCGDVENFVPDDFRGSSISPAGIPHIALKPFLAHSRSSQRAKKIASPSTTFQIARLDRTTPDPSLRPRFGPIFVL